MGRKSIVGKKCILLGKRINSSALGIGRATAPVSRAHQDRSLGGHIHTITQTYTIRGTYWRQSAHRLGLKYKGFPQEHNIQIVLASHRGRGRASISVVGGPMLQSSIAIDSLPSDLSGPEVVAISWDLALIAHTQEKHMTISGHHYQRCCSD